ncbi:hypothetical protein MMC30_008154 [Trapelia coarctata]|nr:hypothetical protein [Trapelia coarctata]
MEWPQAIYLGLESAEERHQYIISALDALYRRLRSAPLSDLVTNMSGFPTTQHAVTPGSPNAKPKAESQQRYPHNDMLDQLRLGGSMTSKQQSQVVALVKSPEPEDWLKAHTSQAVLIHGATPDDETEEPPSFLSAKLAASLLPADPIMCVQCSCVLRPNNVHTMMRSLLGQLLTQEKYHFCLDHPTHAGVQSLKANDLKTLCITFGTLISQLPPASAVFCIIDNIAALEGSAAEPGDQHWDDQSAPAACRSGALAQ